MKGCVIDRIHGSVTLRKIRKLVKIYWISRKIQKLRDTFLARKFKVCNKVNIKFFPCLRRIFILVFEYVRVCQGTLIQKILDQGWLF